MAHTAAATDQRAVLIVASAHDETCAHLGRSLTTAGARVQFATDVYMAMAALATGESFGHVIVDAAALDDYERQFLTLAPRYFEDCSFYVPGSEPAEDEAAVGERCEVLPVEEIVDAILGIRDAQTVEVAPDADADWTEPRTIGESAAPPATPAPDSGEHHPHGDALAGKLSTDGLSESPGLSPSLHDAVRERMGNGAAPARRRPPGSDEPPPATPGPDDARISPEEMNALLGGEEQTLDEMTDDARREPEDES